MLTLPPHVVVLDRSDSLVRNLAKAIDLLDEQADVQLFVHPSEIDAVLAEGLVQVLLVGPSELTGAGLRRVAKWHVAHPETVVVVATEKDRLPDPTLLVRAGAELLLRLPAGPASMRRTLTRALEVAARRREALATTVHVPHPRAEPEPCVDEPGEGVELTHSLPEEEAPRAPAVTITVASATGGCGKTFLATNLAYLLARRSGGRVAMIDLDVQFGELAPTLRLKPTASIADLVVDEDGRVDLTGLMTAHPSGFDVLAAPPDPVAADRLAPRAARAAIEALRASYDYVIVDTPPTLNEVVLDAFDISDKLLVLATLDVPSIRNMRVFLNTLERLRIRQDGIHLLLNKAERGVALSSSDIQSLLGRSWDVELPYDKAVSRSVNLGVAVTDSDPRCAVSRRLVAGVPTLVPGVQLDLPETPRKPWAWARLTAGVRRTPVAVQEEAS